MHLLQESDTTFGGLILISVVTTSTTRFPDSSLYSVAPDSGMFGMAAVDITLWDLNSKYLEVPLVELLGGPSRAVVPAYAMARDFSKEPEKVHEIVRAVAEQGFRGIKWYPNHGP